MPERLLLKNCLPYDARRNAAPIDLLLEDGRIAQMGPKLSAPPGAETLEAEGRVVAPGFIDVHIQGAGGADVLDGTTEALHTMARTLPRFGTTSFLATTAFHFNKPNHHLEVAARAVGKDLGGAHLLGIHLEGPFINPDKRGGMSPTCIGPPSSRTWGEVFRLTGDALKMMTIAPELNGAIPLVIELLGKGVVPSFGHSAATYEQAAQGFAAGIRHVTHLFNAMAPFHHRVPGPLPAIAETKGVTVQLIADGVHVHQAAVRLAWRLLGPQGIVCITDGIQALGLPEGGYVYNGREYEARNGIARYLDGTLIGTAMGLNSLVRRLQLFTRCSLKQAIDTVTANPARLLGLQRKGALAVGADADLVVLEEGLAVWATIVGGKTRFRRE
ncbi:MAG: N-acetylglucosamine-6-phosphate deacetylase [bacterium]|jgi:N-acetylglucosamine-6-phosphate deacetylase|nr:N-acetylglucosamine-6-phosphate deacetylase [candidate division KSB1 bacterium]MDH7559141.1 N-acetylglucosamine-6-phosphate deacetylase [bacterium]